MSIKTAEDRSLCVQPHQRVITDWVDIDLCVLGCRDQMAPAAIERAFEKLLQNDGVGKWPCPIGHWQDGRFVVCDGRHEFLATLMLGRTQIFVGWLSEK